MVIRALQLEGVSAALADLSSAVTTHPRHHMKVTAAVPGDDQRFTNQVDGFEVARIGDLIDPTDAHPLLTEDLVDLEGVEIVGGVDVGRQRSGKLQGQRGDLANTVDQ